MIEKLIKQLKDNWFIYAFFAGLILWYGNINSRMSAVEAAQNEQKVTLSKLDQLSIDIAVVKNDVGYIKERLK